MLAIGTLDRKVSGPILAIGTLDRKANRTPANKQNKAQTDRCGGKQTRRQGG